MTTHTIHIRISNERYRTLQTIANGSEYDPSVTSVATALLERAVDAKAASLVRQIPAVVRGIVEGSSERPLKPLVTLPISWPDGPAGPRLLAARTKAGLSLRALGSMLNINSGTLSRAERGGTMPADALAWVERQEAAGGTAPA